MSRSRLSALDEAFLALESPQAPMHLGWAALFPPPAGRPRPSFDELVELCGMVGERREPVAAAGAEVGGEASGVGAAAQGVEPNGFRRPRRAAQSARVGDSHEPPA